MKNLSPKSVLIAFGNLILLLVIIFLCSAENSFAQFCSGLTSYVVRDENGAKMNAEQLKEVVITQINGKNPIVEKTAKGEVYYQVHYYNDDIRVYLANPLWVAACGLINDLTLQYKNKTMELFIERNSDYQTYLLIDSLPFQAGMFQLQKKFDGYKPVLPCVKTSVPNLNVSRVCNVSADNWLNLKKK